MSKCGDRLVRSYLYEAANTILARVEKCSRLKAWGTKLMKRSGGKKAKVAAARKIAVIMYRMWLNGTDSHWSGKSVSVKNEKQPRGNEAGGVSRTLWQFPSLSENCLVNIESPKLLKP